LARIGWDRFNRSKQRKQRRKSEPLFSPFSPVQFRARRRRRTDFSLHTSEGVNIYSKRDGDVDFKFPTSDNASPYIDNRPLLARADPNCANTNALNRSPGVDWLNECQEFQSRFRILAELSQERGVHGAAVLFVYLAHIQRKFTR
jgi:hypothetical protein